MKYFFIKYTDNIPERFAGETKGPLIKIRPKFKGDVGITEHEKVHVKQWYFSAAVCLAIGLLLSLLVSEFFWVLMAVAPAVHPMCYRFLRPYRRWSEVQAYRKQIAVGAYASYDFALTALVEKYDLRLEPLDAKQLLSN